MSVTRDRQESRANKGHQVKTADEGVLVITENLDRMERTVLQASQENLGRSAAEVLTAGEGRKVRLDLPAKLDPWAHAGFQATTAYRV